ncbi:hypothetical protein HMPREF1624_08360 [Sporothrix schenckii ATCC 58251]|uniref:GH18 domain-containing protein n=1 Tax=Sporothrix schenckii (strain ATCC 58251 / de Perez 2211183) TaxID=1391915 RepID=U7PKV2_SPOS1|nr:hypothetical protein HMPREF1624_08360 [Sporothrix schenckii ATCC 58251]
MAPLPPSPKVVVYHQTHHTRDGQRPISILPLIGRDDGAGSSRPSATHIVVAAVHINGADGDKPITLNDHAPDHARFDVLWSEVAAAQARGVRVLALLGGAAKGSYERLDVGRGGVSRQSFETHYALLHGLLRRRRLDGVDLDVEEPMSLPGIVHLIDRLRADFGPAFLLTMAPVAAALLRPYDPRCNLSGFSYADLERQRGHEIAWYHAQFYCGWGDASQPHMYATMVGLGPPGSGLGGAGGPAGLPPQAHLPGPIVWPAHRVVMGLVTNPANGPGFVPLDTSAEVMMQLQAATSAAAVAFPGVPGIRGGPFAGVSGWEYFNSMPGGEERPWEWAEWMSAILGTTVEADGLPGNMQTVTPVGAANTKAPSTETNIDAEAATATSKTASAAPWEADPDSEGGPDAPVPGAFEYTTDTEES